MTPGLPLAGRGAMDPLVERALATEGMTPVGCHRISEFGSGRSVRHAYRVALADGRTIKARRTLSDDRARAVCELLRAIADDRFTRVLSRHESVLIEEWVEGVALSPTTATPRIVSEAATLLAKVHAVAEVDGVPVRHDQTTDERREVTDERLASLAAVGAVSSEETAVLRAALRDSDPRTAPGGVVHLDFAFRNMVMDRRGRLRVVDNEAVGCDAFEYDLARAWYGNANAPACWMAFEDEYRRAGGPGASSGQPVFWRIASVVEGAVTRLQVDADRAQEPIDRLRAMAAELRRPAV